MTVEDDPVNKTDPSGHQADMGSLSFEINAISIISVQPTVRVSPATGIDLDPIYNPGAAGLNVAGAVERVFIAEVEGPYYPHPISDQVTAMQAIGSTFINRVNSSKWGPTDIISAIKQPGQIQGFSGYPNGLPYRITRDIKNTLDQANANPSGKFGRFVKEVIKNGRATADGTIVDPYAAKGGTYYFNDTNAGNPVNGGAGGAGTSYYLDNKAGSNFYTQP